MSATARSGAAPDSLLEAARRVHLSDPLVRCRFCRAVYRPHRGFADHRDQCELNPLNRPHITGTANAPGITLDLQEADFS